MALTLRSLALFASSATATPGEKVNHYTYATADTLATVLAAGYFNDARLKPLKIGDVILVSSGVGGTNDFAIVRVTAVPSSGNVTVAKDGGAAEGGDARAVVPTSDGLTTGLILATDTYISLASADANHFATLPAIADVPLGKRIVGKNGATACELRTPASSTTKINNGQADSNEAVIAANVSVFIEKTAADNWSVLTATGGAVACPTPD